jgi:hypothetical protein
MAPTIMAPTLLRTVIGTRMITRTGIIIVTVRWRDAAR